MKILVNITTAVGPTLIPGSSSSKYLINPAPVDGIGALSSASRGGTGVSAGGDPGTDEARAGARYGGADRGRLVRADPGAQDAPQRLSRADVDDARRRHPVGDTEAAARVVLPELSGAARAGGEGALVGRSAGVHQGREHARGRRSP